MVRKSGIYGLVGLAGSPINPADARALNLAVPSSLATHLCEGVDRQSAAVSRVENETGLMILVGDVEEGGDLARSLGLAATANPAAIAQAALARFGPQLPARMVGEYTCVSVDHQGYVTLIQSAALRDPLLYAVRAGCLAISPSVFALARLEWVGRRLDSTGLAASLGRVRTRHLRDNRTILQGVYEVLPGESIRIAPDGQMTRSTADVLPHIAPFQGSRADALVAVENLLTRIARERLARDARPAILLSGGLDSTVLATFLARARASGQRVGAITSVAPPGAELVDERAEATLVAQVLRLELHLCWPAPEANPYVPRAELFLGRNGPLLSNRHALTDAMHGVARDFGATLLVNGTFGEGSVTARGDMPAPLPRDVGRRMRALVRQVLRQLRPPQPQGTGFHARLAPDLLASLPDSFAAPPALPPVVPAGDGLFGYSRTALNAFSQPNEYAPGAIRMEYPFRDLRLLRLFASLPRSFLQAEDGDREFGRHLLGGHLPDAIRFRKNGRPASPDHLVRLRAFAPITRELIGQWRAAGVGDWVDLRWLDRALAHTSQREAGDIAFSNQVQITAMTAAFFAWWLQPQVGSA